MGSGAKLSSPAASKAVKSPKRRPKGAKPRLKGEERRTQILDMALALFRTQGYQPVRMADIAQACEITKPVLYSHFPSKDSLFEACLMVVANEMTEKLVSALANYEGDERSVEGIRALMEFVQANGPLVTEGQAAGIKDSRVEAMLEAHRSQISGAITRILAGMRPATMDEATAITKVEPLAHALLGAADGGARWWQTRPHVKPEETQRLSRLVLDSFIALARKELAT